MEQEFLSYLTSQLIKVFVFEFQEYQGIAELPSQVYWQQEHRHK